MSRIFGIGALLVALTASAHAGTYYFATNGKPENDGSREKPWPSVALALAKVGGGNRIVVRPGVYRGPIEIALACAGTQQSPTVIQAEEKWKAVVIGSPEHCIVNGDRGPWVSIDGFEVLGARYDGIKLNGDHNVVRNCWVHNNTQMGIAMHGVHDGTIENNLVEFNGCNVQFDHGVYADGDGLTVRGNIVRHSAGYGLHLYPSLRNSLVALNLVYGHPRQPGVIVSCPHGGGRNRVLHNTIAENDQGIAVWNGNG
jgi:parallel beta-helix repeat protein